MAILKNPHGKIIVTDGETAADLLRLHPHAVNPETGKVTKRGYQVATKEEWDAQLAADNEKYEKEIRPADARIAAQSRGIVLNAPPVDVAALKAQLLAELKEEGLVPAKKSSAKKG